MSEEAKNKRIPVEKLVKIYAEGVGEVSAKKIIQDALTKLGLPPNTRDLSKDDAIKLCNLLSKNKGFIGIVSRFILARIYTDQL